jgi:futalosine hydrolase
METTFSNSLKSTTFRMEMRVIFCRCTAITLKSSMFLLVTATEREMDPLREALGQRGEKAFFVCGVGPVESAVRLTRFLAQARNDIAGVILAGVAGGYLDCSLGLLDLCLAEEEILGDFGICGNGQIVDFSQSDLQSRKVFDLQSRYLTLAEDVLAGRGIPYRKGSFVTVNCSSGTAARGRYLRDRHHALCENMEGASVVRVCLEFGLPCLEMRTISNMVEDRDPSRWRLAESIARLASNTALVVAKMDKETW